MPEAPRAARDTKRQHRLTAAEDADVARALMTRITLLSAGLLEYAQPGVPAAVQGELYRSRQLLERFMR